MATDNRPSVSLDVFDGPLDLLLYLVHSHELDPRTIPLAQIADQYMVYLEAADETSLTVAGEYLVMAAKLLALKARELLPREQQGDLEPEEFDGFDREELVRQLLEYRKFKHAAASLRALESRVWGTFPRGMTDAQGEKPKVEDDETLEAGLMGLFDLLKAFRQVLSVRPRSVIHEIEIDDIPLEERMNRIRAHLVREGKAFFEELYPHDGRKLVPVVTFMAILELTKTEELAFRQAGVRQPMTVYRRNDERFAEEMAHVSFVYTPDPEVNPDIVGLLAEKERLRIESLAREEALWGGDGLDPETGEPLPDLASLQAPKPDDGAAPSDPSLSPETTGVPEDGAPQESPAETVEATSPESVEALDVATASEEPSVPDERDVVESPEARVTEPETVTETSALGDLDADVLGDLDWPSLPDDGLLPEISLDDPLLAPVPAASWLTNLVQEARQELDPTAPPEPPSEDPDPV